MQSHLIQTSARMFAELSESEKSYALAELSESARTLALRSLSENTLRAYRSSIRGFRAWLDGRIASSELLTEYCVAEFEAGKSFAVVNQILAAVAWWCKLDDLPFLHPRREVFAGIRHEAHGRSRSSQGFGLVKRRACFRSRLAR